MKKIVPTFSQLNHYEKLEDLVAAAADDLPSMLSAAVPLIVEHGPKILDKLIGWFTNKVPSPPDASDIPNMVSNSDNIRNDKNDKPK